MDQMLPVVFGGIIVVAVVAAAIKIRFFS